MVTVTVTVTVRTMVDLLMARVAQNCSGELCPVGLQHSQVTVLRPGEQSVELTERWLECREHKAIVMARICCNL